MVESHAIASVTRGKFEQFFYAQQRILRYLGSGRAYEVRAYFVYSIQLLGPLEREVFTHEDICSIIFCRAHCWKYRASMKSPTSQLSNNCQQIISCTLYLFIFYSEIILLLVEYRCPHRVIFHPPPRHSPPLLPQLATLVTTIPHPILTQVRLVPVPGVAKTVPAR